MKKILKRFLFIFVIALTTVSATACSNNSTKTSSDMELLKTLSLEQPTGVKLNISYYGKGDIAYKQTANNEMPYSVFGGREIAEQKLGPIVEQYKNLKGVNHKVEYLDDKIVETLEVNFKELDIEQAKNVPGLIVDGGDPRNGVSVSKSTELLKKQGFNETK